MKKLIIKSNQWYESLPDPIHNAVNIVNDDNDIGQYWTDRFITIDEWREKQLNKIL
jgi:hypothetical protein